MTSVPGLTDHVGDEIVVIVGNEADLVSLAEDWVDLLERAILETKKNVGNFKNHRELSHVEVGNFFTIVELSHLYVTASDIYVYISILYLISM
jgi:hypothetical protein